MAATWQVAVSAAAVGLAAAVVSIVVAGPWEGGQRSAERAATGHRGHSAGAGSASTAREPVPEVLAALGGAQGQASADQGALNSPLPSRQALESAMRTLLRSPDLGDRHTVAVVDAATGALLYGVGENTPATPASTIKIATAVAVLTVLGPEHRIATSVTQGAKPDEIVLSSGGDPTLTARNLKAGPDQPASLRQLAQSTADALKDRGTRKVRLHYDDSAYTGPKDHHIGHGNDNIAAVTALMVDEGRVNPTSTAHAPRDPDPPAAAAGAFAELLKDDGVEVQGRPTPGQMVKTNEGQLAEVRSLTLGQLVERMLTTSDNDIAEALARQTAIAVGKPASFTGAAQAVHQVLGTLGLPLSGASFHDGSGLDNRDALSAALLAKLLAVAAAPERTELRPVLTGLPVAGFTGTLQDRYGASSGASAQRAAGLIRAKTGTLTGVNTLAGTVVGADGRLLTFAFTAKGTSDPTAATTALDRLAATLATCSCR